MENIRANIPFISNFKKGEGFGVKYCTFLLETVLILAHSVSKVKGRVFLDFSLTFTL